MPDLNEIITNFAVGDDFDVERTITGVPSSATLVQAWLTVKNRITDADAQAVFQVSIASAYVAGSGQITDTGADGTGEVRFEVTKANSLLLTPGKGYHFDVQVESSTGKIYTPYAGTMRGSRQVTRATS